MGFTKEQLLSRLQFLLISPQELQISFSQYEHPVVLTVEAQAKYVGHLDGALSKNLFLKDKKQRFYIVSALAETKVDLKVLSQRLGLGKGGIRMAPEEALAEILQVPLGCVTPFALVNESARKVSLLLDQGFKSQKCCFFHPLSNDASITLNVRDLDKFLISIGKTPAYVDLEANPTVGKDQPPDLASLVPSETTVPAEPLLNEGSCQASENNPISVNSQSTASASKAVKPSNGPTKEKSSSPENLSASYADPDKFIEEILQKTSSMIISKIKKENMENHREQLANFVSNSISNEFRMELKNIATIFKNTAYTEGFSAGIHQQLKRL